MQESNFRFFNISVFISIVVLISFAYYHAINFMPRKFVLNIYSQYPISFWIIILLLYILILIFGIINYDKRNIFILAITALYLIPFIMVTGYYLPNRGDDLSHLGEIRYIIRKGHFLFFNPYPATHVLIGIVVQITNIYDLSLIHLSFPLLSLLFILGIYMITREILAIGNIKSNNILIHSLLIPLLYIYYLAEYHITLRPHQITFIIFSFVLLIILKYFESKKQNYFILLIIFSIFLVIGHLFVAVAFFLAILAIIISFSIANRENIFKLIIGYKNLILLNITFIVLWIIYNYTIYGSFSDFLTLFIKGTPVGVMLVTENLIGGRFTIDEIVVRGVLLYLGRYVYMLALFVFSLIYCLANSKIRKKIFSDKLIRELILLLLLFGGIQTSFFLIPFSKHNPQRFLNLNIVIYIFIPLLIYFFNRLSQYNMKVLVLLAIALISSYVTSLFSFFPSPLIYQPNNAVTYAEINGMDWLDKYKTNLNIRDFSGEFVYRYYTLKDGFFYTREYNQEIMKNRYSRYGADKSKYMDHLLYYKYKSFPLRNYYIVLTTKIIKSYLELPKWKEINRLNRQDLIKFYNDCKVNKVYSSQDINIFKT